MKKVMYSMLMLLVLSSAPLWAYTVSGKVYYKDTTIPVPYASLRLTESNGASNPGFSDQYGSYSIGWKDSNLVGRGMRLTASSNFYWGSESWTAAQNTETKDVYVSLCIEPNPSIHLDSMALSPAGGNTFKNPVVIQAPHIPVQVRNAQVNINFHPPAVVIGVQPAPDVQVISWNMPVPGELRVEVEVDPPQQLQPDFPAESFFDVFFEIDLPETGAELFAVTIDSAELLILREGEIDPVNVDVPVSTTENLLGEPEACKVHFLVDAQQDWMALLGGEWPDANIRPMTPAEWNDPEWGYMMHWSEYLQEGDPYPPTEFLPAKLYVHEGGGSGGTDPEDAGLVMVWGDENTPTGEYASAWKYDYGLDPDLSNSIITITVTAPQMGPAGQINAVSFGIQDINGNIRSWWWSCGPAPAPIPWNTPTTITIDTTQIGLAAATPPATGFMNNPAFNLTQSQFFIVDENFQWVFGQQPVPPPGQQQFVGMWNYWHNLTVTKKTNAYKGTYIKWTQPPVVLDENEAVPKINGWDEKSVHTPAMQPQQIMADDWLCTDNRPITDLHWWGSFIGWTQPHLPPVLPKAFHIGIWTDVPVGPGVPFSHPGVMIWEHTCDKWVWNFAGYDVDPRIGDPDWQENEACFQFNQLLSQDDWFYQEPAGPEGQVYWLSIAAIYDAGVQVQHPWGWKTRPHYFNDDGVRIQSVMDPTGLLVWPPVLGSTWNTGTPVEFPQGISWDLAFELTTNEPAYADNPIPGDIAGPDGPGPDGKVNLDDFALMAANWLVGTP